MAGGAIIYALGAGAGHLARALTLAGRLGAASHPGSASAGACLILHRAPFEPPAPRPGVRLLRVPGAWTLRRFRRALEALLDGAERLVVDTFPAGLAGELDDRLLAQARRRTLIRRYVRPGAYPDHAALAARFDDVLSPYPADRSEWEEPAPREIPLGYVTRPIGLAGGDPLPLVVIGDPARLPPGYRALLPARTGWIHGPFAALPRARAYLSIGAGYNIAYELLALGAPFGLIPLEKRYDDQFRRADLLGRAVLTRRDLERLLSSAGGRAV
jgi:hypothetical protein